MKGTLPATRSHLRAIRSARLAVVPPAIHTWSRKWFPGLLILGLSTIFASARPRPPMPPYPEQSLNSWRFNGTSWLTNLHTAPLVYDNLQLIESWSGHALQMTGPSGLLALPNDQPDGTPNLTPAEGSIHFWFAPAWTSQPEGTGPSVASRLFEVGAWSRTAAQAWWSLAVSPDGSLLGFLAAQDTFVEISVSIGQRTNIFLIAVNLGTLPPADFEGISYDPNNAVAPPDTMGAVGRKYFIELLNGKLAVFEKGGGPPTEIDSKVFFHVAGTIPSAVRIDDPRVLYDQHTNRWIALGLDGQTFGGSDNVILAVSKDSSPLPLPTLNEPGNWIKHVIHFGTTEPTDFTDFDTLGLDENGIYVSAIKFSDNRQKILAIRKSVLYGSQTTQDFEENSGANWYKIWTESFPDVMATKTVHPAVNFDPVPADGYALFIVKGPAQTAPYRGGAIRYRRLKWPGSTGLPDWVPNEGWQDLPQPMQGNYRDYYDLDGGTLKAPQMGGTSQVQLGGNYARSTSRQRVLHGGDPRWISLDVPACGSGWDK